MLKNLFLGLLAALSFFAAAPAWAVGYWYALSQTSRHSTALAAADHYIANSGNYSTYVFESNGATSAGVAVLYYCAKNPNGTWGNCISVTSRFMEVTCPEGQTFSSVTLQCSSGPDPVDTACPVGETRTTGRTEGWAKSPTPGANDYMFDNGPPNWGAYDDGKCVGSVEVDQCFRSQEPAANGLYRVSCDYTMTNTGPSSGTGADPASDPTVSPPACPGFVGEVNGKTTCVGNAQNPLPSSTDNPGHVTPNTPGNPAAGEKPSEGEGSGSDGAGRTPSTGDGGNAGGPGGAASGGGTNPGDGDGDGDSPDPCGAPGQAQCNVKVNEAGTKSQGDYSAANGALDGAADALVTAMGDHTKRTGLGGAEWAFVFPSGTCQPIAMGWSIFQFTLDLCSFPMIDFFRELWAWAFGVMGAIYVWRSATSSVG